MKYSSKEIKGAIRALKASIVYRYEPAEATLEVALDCMQFCLETGEMVFPTRDVLEKAHTEGFNEGYKTGVETIVELYEKIYGLERKTIEVERKNDCESSSCVFMQEE